MIFCVTFSFPFWGKLHDCQAQPRHLCGDTWQKPFTVSALAAFFSVVSFLWTSFWDESRWVKKIKGEGWKKWGNHQGGGNCHLTEGSESDRQHSILPMTISVKAQGLQMRIVCVAEASEVGWESVGLGTRGGDPCFLVEIPASKSKPSFPLVHNAVDPAPAPPCSTRHSPTLCTKTVLLT